MELNRFVAIETIDSKAKLEGEGSPLLILKNIIRTRLVPLPEVIKADPTEMSLRGLKG